MGKQPRLVCFSLGQDLTSSLGASPACADLAFPESSAYLHSGQKVPAPRCRGPHGTLSRALCLPVSLAFQQPQCRLGLNYIYPGGGFPGWSVILLYVGGEAMYIWLKVEAKGI